MSKIEQACFKDMREDLIDLAKDIGRINLQMLERGDRVLRLSMYSWRDKAQKIIKKYGDPGE